MKLKILNTRTNKNVLDYKLAFSDFKLQEKGFSILELIIAVGIIAFISTIAVASYYALVSRADLSGNAKNMISTLNLARSETVTSNQANPWGVHFETDKYALFKGSTYNAADSSTKIYTIPSSLEISDIALNGGGSEVLFARITGQTTNYGNITIRNKAQTTNLINITIETSGQASATTLNQPSTDTRITDSRHIHFTYNGNAQTATTLLLSFPDYPADNISIPFQNYLTPAKDSFSWEQTVTVNGITRMIRINTHLLTSSQADFSIHREKENNTEAMNADLDGQNLINYTALGQESQGTSAWVTAPVRQ